MKIFIVGLPESGRTTVAKALCDSGNCVRIDTHDWLKVSFRAQREDEHPEQYHDAFHHWYLHRLKEDKDLITNHVNSTIAGYESPSHWIIDSVNNPSDFSALFDPGKDFVVFLNRTDVQEVKVKDYETIGVSVSRDYCFWLSAANILPRDRWYEYNFKLHGTSVERFKTMGSKNSVFIVGSLDRVISHLKDALSHHLSQASEDCSLSPE